MWYFCSGLEYAYSEAPRSFQSLIMGLFYAMEGVGSFLGVALLQILAPFWLNNMTDYGNINDNHMDFYLYFLGILQIITLIIYTTAIYVARFSLELVPMPCDRGIGGPMDRRRLRGSRRGGRVSYRELVVDDRQGRVRNEDQVRTLTGPDTDDDEMVNPDADDGGLLPVDESDDSVGVKESFVPPSHEGPGEISGTPVIS